MQRALAEKLPVISLDCNRFTLDAAFGDYFDGQTFRPHPEGGYDRCLHTTPSRISITCGLTITGPSIHINFPERNPMDPRQEFLVEMYKQLMADINRHIMVVWQSVGVLLGAFAVFASVEKKVLSPDIATSLIVLLCGWLYAHLLDASYWYNRNLAMIANIERQFLNASDLRNIHYYFGSHRSNNKMIIHLWIQTALGIGLYVLVLLFHFLNRVASGLKEPIANLEFSVLYRMSSS
jgi:hypothetical protein